MENLTPMMQQYMEIKKQYKDCILFYRLGDFYEMFFDDAMICSKELEITLTGKNCGQEERAPMCGVPYHAVEGYLGKLISKGYKVGICEQIEDPKMAKGIVKRDVIRIVTPGTNMNTQALDQSKNNYIMCIVLLNEQYGISLVDITTGDFYVTEVSAERGLLDEIYKYAPSEIVCNEGFLLSGAIHDDMKEKMHFSVSMLEYYYFDQDACEDVLKEHFHVTSLQGLGMQDYETGMIAAGALLKNLYTTQKNSLEHLTTITPYSTSKYMILDTSTRRNLELAETLREKQKRGSLLWVLDKTKTAMGARLLRSYLEQPLIEKTSIEERLDAIEELKQNMITREEIREYLNPIYDMERLMSRVCYQNANPRDLVAFRSSIKMLPPIKTLMQEFKSPLLCNLEQSLDVLADLYELVDKAIIEEPPFTMKEGGIIKDGFSEEIDHLRRAKTDGKDWLAQLEEEERNNSGIKNLRVKYNKVFGYYLEVTNSYLDMVPNTWTRKQTLTNAERYITPKLKELEDTILGAEERLFSLEYHLFVEVRDKIAEQIQRIQKTAKAIAAIDTITNLALVAERNNYVRPMINEEGRINIVDGRHPVVEKMLNNDMFVANNTYLDNEEKRVSIITGPNMAGKSTYMRQVALIVLMAQIGSFVPAREADIGIVDRIFTRVGASDDLASGQSTFMVEMTEVANILRNATANSLLILDEIGRGTSTFDGLSIAWAVVEHISDRKLLGAKALFATHYHELTELEGKLESVHNYCIAVKEQGEDIVFLRKIIAGGADKSYGIQVARLAGIPESVLARAREIAEQLDGGDILKHARMSQEQADYVKPGYEKSAANANKKSNEIENQLSFMDYLGTLKTENMSVQDFTADKVQRKIVEQIEKMELATITPIEALNALYRLQKQLKEQ